MHIIYIEHTHIIKYIIIYYNLYNTDVHVLCENGPFITSSQHVIYVNAVQVFRTEIYMLRTRFVTCTCNLYDWGMTP